MGRRNPSVEQAGQDPTCYVSRLARNRHVAWPYRLLIGLPVTLVFEVLLPGRLFPWGDYYNPYTNTVHLYSDHAAVALHEAGHAHDLASRRFKGTDEALDYLKASGDRTGEVAAYKILYP